MEMEPEKRRLFLALTILGVIAAWLSLPPAYANWRAFIELLWGKSTISLQVEKPPINERGDRHPAPVKEPSAESKTEPIREREPLPHVGGTWRSRSSLVYFFVHTDPSTFDIYQETPDNQQIRIGSGRVTRQGIKATIKTLKEGRLAELDLQFSADGNTLIGTFSGMAKREKNFPLTLSKEA